MNPNETGPTVDARPHLWRRAIAAALAAAALLTAGAAAAPGAQSAWVGDWLADYRSGRHEEVSVRLDKVSRLDVLLADLEELSGAWIRATGSTETRQRRVLAAFALEAAYLRLEQGESATKLIEFGCRQVRRNTKPEEFERRWHLVAFALLEGAVSPDAIDAHATHVKFQFPNEPRISYSRAVAEALRVAPFYARGRLVAEREKRTLEAVKRFQEAAKHDAQRRESALRIGYLLLSIGRSQEAIDAFRTAETGGGTDDVMYLALVFRGRAHEQQSQPEEALAAYRAALALRPRHQAALTALAALQFRRGERDEADRLIAWMLSATQPTADPWWTFWPADFVHADRLIREMRSALK